MQVHLWLGFPNSVPFGMAALGASLCSKASGAQTGRSGLHRDLNVFIIPPALPLSKANTEVELGLDPTGCPGYFCVPAEGCAQPKPRAGVASSSSTGWGQGTETGDRDRGWGQRAALLQ